MCRACRSGSSTVVPGPGAKGKDEKTIQKEVADFVASKVANHMKLRGGVFIIDAIPKRQVIPPTLLVVLWSFFLRAWLSCLPGVWCSVLPHSAAGKSEDFTSHCFVCRVENITDLSSLWLLYSLEEGP